MRTLEGTLLVAGFTLGVMIISPAAAARDAPGEGGRGHGRDAGGPGMGRCASALTDGFQQLPQQQLSVDEREAILFLREEEKLARDVYLTLAEHHAPPVFSNIARAEQRHMDAVGLLISRYGLEDPIADDALGAFTNSELKSLYEEFVARGTESLESALRVGATIEDMDLADLAALGDSTDNTDVKLIVSRLSAGSRNHLRAFSRGLARRGHAPYTPTFLDAATVAEILASAHDHGMADRGRGPRSGRCGGRGPAASDLRPGSLRSRN
jgi:hypothetical protein